MRFFRLLIFFMVVLAVTAEVALRVTTPNMLSISGIIRPSDNEILEYDLKPGADIIYRGMLRRIPETRIQISSQGFRDRVFPASGGSARRLAFVGDSYIFGQGLNLEDTVPKQLENILNSRSAVRYEVMNCGVSGYNLEQEMEFIKERVMAYHPDILILAIGPNDIDRKIVIPRDRISNALFAMSYIYRRINLLINESRTKKDRAGIHAQMRLDSAMRSFKGLPGILGKGQPVVLVIKNFQPWMAPFIQTAKDNGYQVLDFSKDYQSREDSITIAPYDRHFNAAGARFMAERVYDLLTREVIKSHE